MNLCEVLASALDHKKTLTERKFLELLRDHAQNAHRVAKTSPLYLQDAGKADFLEVRPSDRVEASPFWVDRLIADLVSWRTYPDRRHCVRGYNQLDRIGTPGEAFVVIPFDRSRVGICSGTSFYKSFGAFKAFDIERLDNSGLARWVDAVVEGVNAVEPGAKLQVGTPEHWVDFKKALGALDKALGEHKAALRKKLKEADVGDEAARALGDLLDRHVTTVERYLDEKLDPQANGFSTVLIESLPKQTADRELWVSSPCLLIRRDAYVELYKKGTIK